MAGPLAALMTGTQEGGADTASGVAGAEWLYVPAARTAETGFVLAAAGTGYRGCAAVPRPATEDLLVLRGPMLTLDGTGNTIDPFTLTLCLLDEADRSARSTPSLPGGSWAGRGPNRGSGSAAAAAEAAAASRPAGSCDRISGGAGCSARPPAAQALTGDRRVQPGGAVGSCGRCGAGAGCSAGLPGARMPP